MDWDNNCELKYENLDKNYIVYNSIETDINNNKKCGLEN